MYNLTEETRIIENERCTVYGIRYNDEHYISDVSADKTAVERLVNDCNKYDLDPVHLSDVVEDFLVNKGA